MVFEDHHNFQNSMKTRNTYAEQSLDLAMKARPAVPKVTALM
jgi:hypothetical protein